MESMEKSERRKPTEAELIDLYETQRKSAHAISLIYGYTRNAISRQIKKLASQKKCIYRDQWQASRIRFDRDREYEACINQNTSLAQTNCPISISRLNELYHIELKTDKEIAQWLTDEYNPAIPFTATRVCTWRKKAGIVGRSLSQAYRMAWRKNKPRKVAASARMSDRNSLGFNVAATLPERKSRVKNAVKSRRKKAGSQLIERVCQWCVKPFRVPAPRIKQGKGKFCSHSCSSSHYQNERKFQRLAASIQPTTAMTREQALAKLGITDIPKHL